jgi:hypothetical protein
MEEPGYSTSNWAARLSRLQLEHRLEEARRQTAQAASLHAVAGYSRRLARFLARLLLRLSRGITVPQRRFNEATLDLIEELIDQRRQLAGELAELNLRCRRLEERLDRESRERQLASA